MELTAPATTLHELGTTLAALPGLVGYGGTGAFEQNASATQGSDVNLLLFLAVIFPVVITVVFINPSIFEDFAVNPFKRDGDD